MNSRCTDVTRCTAVDPPRCKMNPILLIILSAVIFLLFAFVGVIVLYYLPRPSCSVGTQEYFSRLPKDLDLTKDDETCFPFSEVKIVRKRNTSSVPECRWYENCPLFQSPDTPNYLIRGPPQHWNSINQRVMS